MGDRVPTFGEHVLPKRTERFFVMGFHESMAASCSMSAEHDEIATKIVSRMLHEVMQG